MYCKGDVSEDLDRCCISARLRESFDPSSHFYTLEHTGSGPADRRINNARAQEAQWKYAQLHLFYVQRNSNRVLRAVGIIFSLTAVVCLSIIMAKFSSTYRDDNPALWDELVIDLVLEIVGLFFNTYLTYTLWFSTLVEDSPSEDLTAAVADTL